MFLQANSKKQQKRKQNRKSGIVRKSRKQVMQHPIMHTAKHLFGFHNEHFIMALHLQVHGYIFNRKKSPTLQIQRYKVKPREGFRQGAAGERDPGECVQSPRVSCRPRHHAAPAAAQAAASPQSPEQGPSFLSPFPTGRGVCQGLGSVRKKEEALKHQKKSYAKRHQKGSIHRQLQALRYSTWHETNCTSCAG